MTSPFLNSGASSNSSTSNITVNSIKPNALGNIILPLKTTLASLNDTNISAPINAQQLTYNSSTQKWQNSTPSTFSTALSALTDCAVSGLANDNVLYYNSTNSKWENKALQESDITSLSTDLSACEKTSNKNSSLGYCPLDINSLVPIANIPSLSESQITNLTTDLRKNPLIKMLQVDTVH